ncbi:protein transport protein SEC16B homolog [Pistacia vera]|uniref:protein transport protein SEC16B homolog n=1 Tax=Pistacia vera TaxID=55513 RepID=UPI001262BE69|nr:protein transport protein SEC16B homolog [Pistacia vera]XP_031269713.1 protein transport protein SEC16B homolog [Pistacia vera]XP_031269714.1 protein transport protein SEC16B homolog [Pistacia vera]
MASPLFEAEDQTDEDFFDKLVNDDDDDITYTGSGPSPVKVDDADKANAFSRPTIGDVGPTRVNSGDNINFSFEELEGDENGVVLASSNDNEDSLVVKESNTVIPSSVNESSEVGLFEEGALNDHAIDKSSISTGTGVKVVHWSSFDSDQNVDDSNGLPSNSGFFNEFGDDSGDPFANLGNTDSSGAKFVSEVGVLGNSVNDLGSSTYGQNLDLQNHDQNSEQNITGQDMSSSQNWENLYPGWRYDPKTGQWHQLDGYNADLSTIGSVDAVGSYDVNAQYVSGSEQSSAVYHLQQAFQSESIVENVTEGATDVSVSNWNQISPGTAEYPSHMVFDPQYPGWYYDTIAQEWRLLESCTPATNQSATLAYNQQLQNDIIENYGSQGLGPEGHNVNWDGSVNNYNQKNTNMWQNQQVAKSETTGFTDNKQSDNLFDSTSHVNNSAEGKAEFRPSGSVAQFEQANWNLDNSNGVSGFQNFIPSQRFSEHHYQTKMESSQLMHFKAGYFDSQKPVSFPKQQQLLSDNQFPYVPSEGRSSAGRPPHALVTFGFGGKIVVLKNCSTFDTNSSFGRKDPLGGVVNVLNLMEVVMDKTSASRFGLGTCDYFHTLCLQSFPGPLVGGNVGNKELNKWIDERIANFEVPSADNRNGEVMRLLYSLLKIACQYYGKLRSPFGTDPLLKESDCPESAVAKLFGSTKKNDVQLSDYGALTYCLQNLPAEAQIQATALEVQKLLVSGRKKEALQRAKEGQLWGLALVLASQLGDQFYGDTVKQMALKQLVAGSPLRTLCLLIAGQPADVFSYDKTTSIIPNSINTYQQPVQIGANCMLDKWEENLAIITANRTKGDELVMIHLGDCLWKERGEVTAAHLCYLVAESNFEPYSDSARLCLIGADHWKFPRTYASPEAIQRTELYEYAKVAGNSQFLLLPFQPYKLIYAHMLAEVGKVADSLKYCQVILKSLRTDRTPEVDTWKQLVSSLEERLRSHQQVGYTTNLAPTKLVGKLRTFFDSTANRVVGSIPPPVPSKPHNVLYNEFAHQQGGQHVTSSYSSTTMSSLMASASVEPISEWTGGTNQLDMPNRSISEPDFGRNPSKVDSSKESNISDTQEQVAVSVGSSRFGRFGSQLFQKTVGLVLRSRPDRQAKLGEKNKFDYDDKLKRWVEEGVEPPAEETALAPPPTFAAFQDNTVNDTPKIESLHTNTGPETQSPITSEGSSGIPPIPPSSNQFSARGRMSVRSRYVDTFNKSGGTSTNLFQSPIPSSKSGAGPNPKFFVPGPVTIGEETVQTTGEIIQETTVTNENPKSPTSFKGSFSPPPTLAYTPATTMQRFPSVDNIVFKRTGVVSHGNNSSTQSRRAASWSGSLSDASSPMMNEIKPLGEALGSPTPAYSDPPSNQFSKGANSRDAFDEVEL